MSWQFWENKVAIATDSEEDPNHIESAVSTLSSALLVSANAPKLWGMCQCTMHPVRSIHNEPV